MRVVLFGHARVRMPKLRRDDAHGNPLHCKRRAVRMSQHVEGGGRRNHSDARSLSERTLLMGRPPPLPVSP